MLVCVWIIGFLYSIWCTFKNLRQVAALRKTLYSDSFLDDRDLIEEVRRRSALPRHPSVVLSTGLHAPSVVGWHHSHIIIPAQLFKQLDREELIGIMLHESAHIRRKDQLRALWQQIIRDFWWFHPLVGKLIDILDQAREEICDSFAAIRCDKKRYAHMLVTLASENGPLTQAGVGLLGKSQNPSAVSARVKNLLKSSDYHADNSSQSHRLATGLICCVGLAASVTLGTHLQPYTATDNTGSSVKESESTESTLKS